MSISLKPIFTFAAFAVAAVATAAVVTDCMLLPEVPPSSPAPARQFDFWLGEWELTWPGEQSGLPAGETGRGTNTITAVLDSCVIQENFADLSPQGFRGISVSVYNSQLGKWQQTWVDNEGGYLDFIGEFHEGKMILSRTAKTIDGKEFLQRMVWYNLAPDALDWNWEASHDGGETWVVKWQIHYQRKA